MTGNSQYKLKNGERQTAQLPMNCKQLPHHRRKSGRHPLKRLPQVRWGPVIFLSLMVLLGSIQRHELPIYAQGSPDPRWTRFTQQSDRLASNNVWSILVDEGALWFGTDNGVSRFDGTWTTYPSLGENAQTNAEGLPDLGHFTPNGLTLALARDPENGHVWAGTDTGSVARWDGDTWHLVAQFRSPVHVLVAFGGRLWVGTDQGLYSVANGNEATSATALGEQPIYAALAADDVLWLGALDGLWQYRQGEWRQIASDQPYFSAGVYALWIDNLGRIYAGTPFGLVWGWSFGSNWHLVETLDELSKPALVQALAGDFQGDVWAATDGAGAVVYDPRQDTTRAYGITGDPNLTTRFVRDVAVDQDGSVWFATPAGVFRYQKQMWFNDEQGSSLDDPLNYINDLLVARDGTLWIATGGAGVRHKVGVTSRDRVFGPGDGVPSSVLTLAEDSQGGIWIGTFEGVRRFDGEVWQEPIAAEALPAPVIASLLNEGDSMWIGTVAGLVHYDVVTGEYTPVSELAGHSIEAMALDSMGRLWLGTRGDGIFLRQSNGSWRQFLHDPNDPDSLPGNFIEGSGLAPDPKVDGGMWAIVSQQGLVHWDGQRWSLADPSNQLPSNLLWTVYTDPVDGSLWIGSEAGVSHFDGLTWGTFNTQDGLLSPIIYAIVRTEEGGYWMGGRTGLSYYRPDHTPPWIRIGLLTGNYQRAANGELQITLGDDLIVNFTAGDLQTPVEKLKILYRETGPQHFYDWREIAGDFLQVNFQETGEHLLEFWARDQSFNYSAIATQRITVIPPPQRVNVPLLGPVEREIFQTLLILGAVALLGAGYVSLEIIQNRRRSAEAVSRGYNPYISGEPVRRDDMFFGRRELVQRIVDTLHNNSIMIHGERRIGKTTLLYYLVNVLRDVDDPEYWFVPIYIDLEGTPQEEFFHLLMEEIAHGIAALPEAEEELMPTLNALRYLTTPASAYTDRDFNRDLREVIELLQGYAQRHHPGKQLRLILLMDEMDVMSRYDHLIQQQLRRIFMREFAATVGAVVAGIQISKEWERVESPWYNLFNEIALEPFSREQAIELLVEPVRGYYTYDPAAIEFILDKSEGRPFRIQQYGLEAVNHMLAAGRRRIRLEDAEAAHEHIQNNTSPLPQPPGSGPETATPPDTGAQPNGVQGTEAQSDHARS